MKNKTVLLVEDEKAIQVLVTYNLQNAGFDTILMERAEDALEFLKSTDLQIDLIITDVLLPGMNGINFCRSVRSNYKTADIPVIILSSVDHEFYREGAASAGASKFMTKPFRIKDFLKIIKELAIK
ncbi:MAG: response regulator [Ignavibacteria bacterium]|nr:response regulator [Ignavibacteria bacterium]